MSDPFVQDDEISTDLLHFINKDEIFGTISIPKINEELPIYLGASQENLSKGVGQIEGLLYLLVGKIHMLYWQDIVDITGQRCFVILIS